MNIPRSRTSILWLGFILVITPRYKNVDAQEAEEFILNLEKPLNDQIRHFPSRSRAIKLQADLNYSQKPLWPFQWYMTEEILTVNNCNYSPSMKIAEMHFKGIKGDGLGVVIIGNTPVNCKHVAFENRCHAKDSSTSLSEYPTKSRLVSWKKKYKLPAPSTVSSEIAGIIGMSGAGKTGAVGIAPKCHIGSVAIQPSSSHGSPEYCATIITARDTFPPAELFVHAWVLPYLDYESDVLHALGNLSLLNFRDRGIELKPHVMTLTKYGIRANSCQCNEYASADSMFPFGSVEYSGYLPPTSETCASLFGVVYSAATGDKLYNNIVTIDSNYPALFCCAKNDDFLVTNPAVGIAGGIIALIIDCFKKKFQKPPSVSDLAFLLAFSSSSETLQDKNILWFSNGMGLMYSQQAGFGLPNMLKVSSLLETWTPTDFPIIYEVTRFTRTLTYSSNLVCHFHITNTQARMHIQLVTVQLSAKLVSRGALSVYLISPAGTVSCILEGRPYDTDKKEYNKLLLRSNHFIGEQLGGRWSIRFYTYKENTKPIHSVDISLNENEKAPPKKEDAPTKNKDAPTKTEDEHPVDAKKHIHPVGDDISIPVPPLSGSESESDVSCEDTNSPNYLQRGRLSRDGKPSFSGGGNQNASKKVRIQEDITSRRNLAGSPPQGQTSSATDPHRIKIQFPSNFHKEEPLVLQPTYQQHQTISKSVSEDDAKKKQTADTVPHLEADSSNIPGKSVPPSSNLESNAPQPTASVASDSSKTSSAVNPKPAPPLEPPVLMSSQQNGPKPISRTKKREPNTVYLSQIKFRFLLHERLPSNLEPRLKDNAKREKDFDLLKAWVDFRHYLFAKLDPEKQKWLPAGTKSPHSILSRHVKYLAILQKNNEIDSVFSVAPDHLNALLGITDVSKPAQRIDDGIVKASTESLVPRNNT